MLLHELLNTTVIRYFIPSTYTDTKTVSHAYIKTSNGYHQVRPTNSPELCCGSLKGLSQRSRLIYHRKSGKSRPAEKTTSTEDWNCHKLCSFLKVNKRHVRQMVGTRDFRGFWRGVNIGGPAVNNIKSTVCWRKTQFL